MLLIICWHLMTGLLFLNDPFGEKLMAPFIKNILNQLKKMDSKFYLVIKNNNKRSYPSLRELTLHYISQEFEYRGNYFEIFGPISKR